MSDQNTQTGRPARGRPGPPAPGSGPAPRRTRAALVAVAIACGLLAGGAASAGSASAAPTRDSAAVGAPAAAVAAPGAPAAPAAGGFTLHVGAAISSPNGSHRLVVSDYGDLLLIGPDGSVVWESATAGEHDASASLLDDGDLVLRSKGGRLLWHTGTNGYGPSALAVTDDGRVVLTSSRGVSWTSVGLPQRAHGGVSQVDPLAARAGTWASEQSFSGSSRCNPYSFLVGRRSIDCATAQARPREAWNMDFASAAWKRSGAAIPPVDLVIYYQNVAAMHLAESSYTPEPGDVAVFYDRHDNSQGRVGVVTEVNVATRMVRLAIGDVDGAVLHVWLPVRDSSFAGEPLHAYAHPLPA